MRKMILIVVIVFVAAQFIVGCATSIRQTLPSTPPISKKVVHFKLPESIKQVLPNGVVIEMIDDPSIPVVNFYFGVAGGDKIDPPGVPGLGAMTMRMLTTGTKTKNATQIAAAIEDIGASLNTGSSTDFFYIKGSALSEDSYKLIDLFGDLLLNPVFSQTELKKQKKRLSKILKYYSDHPSYVAKKLFFKKTFSNTPFAEYGATLQSLKKLTPSMLKQFYNENLREIPKNGFARFIIAGDLSGNRGTQKLLKKLKPILSQLKGVMKQRFINTKIKNQGKGVLYIVDRPGSAQSYILSGMPAEKFTNRDYVNLYTFNELLGGGASRRLFKKLREEMGLTYGAYSSSVGHSDFGYFMISLQTSSSKTGKALAALFNVADKLAKQAPSTKELLTVKNYLIGSFPMKNEHPRALLSRIFMTRFFGLKTNFWFDFLNRIHEIKPKTIQKTASKYLPLEQKATTIIVGDAKAIKKQITFNGKIVLLKINDIIPSGRIEK